MNFNTRQYVEVILRNPLNKKDTWSYVIQPYDIPLADAWLDRLKQLLDNDVPIEKNYCFFGFVDSPRNIEYICNELNDVIKHLNLNLENYHIPEVFSEQAVILDDEYKTNHDIMNKLHLHFETLQGTVGNMSDYYNKADTETRYCIRQLNNLCHELESYILSKRKFVKAPKWSQTHQITTFLNAPRFELEDEYYDGFLTNGYQKEFGGVYMHWAQIGKTHKEVFDDEDGKPVDDVICSAITPLRYYSGEFDVTFARDTKETPEHDEDMQVYYDWLDENGFDRTDKKLSLGYLKIGQVNTNGYDPEMIWSIISKHLDIYQIKIITDGLVTASNTFDYCWSDNDFEQKQIERLSR